MRRIFLVAAASALGSAAPLGQPALAQAGIQATGSVGIETHYQSYKEPSLAVEETGWFGGLTAEGQLEANLWQLRGDIRFALGSMDYTGSGKINDINDRAFEGRVLLARVFPFGAAHRAIPYIGYGYRRLEDDLGGRVSSTGALGYDRISQYHYIPIGLETVFATSGDWSFKPTIEYDYFVAGNQESKLSQVAAGFADIDNSQNSGYGLRASLMARTTWGGTPIEFGPFVRYWNIDRSDIAPVTFDGVTIGGGYEPANETVEVGLALKSWF